MHRDMVRGEALDPYREGGWEQMCSHPKVVPFKDPNKWINGNDVEDEVSDEGSYQAYPYHDDSSNNLCTQPLKVTLIIHGKRIIHP